MTFIKISIDALKELLATAYENGWRGSLELKDDVAESLLKDAGELLVEPPTTLHGEGEGINYDGTIDSVVISADPAINLDGEPMLADMNPDLVIQEFGLEDRPDISVPDVSVADPLNPNDNIWIDGDPIQSPDPADRRTWNLNVTSDQHPTIIGGPNNERLERWGPPEGGEE